MTETAKMDNKVIIHGIIDDVREHNGVWYYDVTLPAANEYSRPASVALSSNRRLPDKKGDILHSICSINSYYRTFTTKSGEPGRDYKTRFEIIDT